MNLESNSNVSKRTEKLSVSNAVAEDNAGFVHELHEDGVVGVPEDSEPSYLLKENNRSKVVLLFVAEDDVDIVCEFNSLPSFQAVKDKIV